MPPAWPTRSRPHCACRTATLLLLLPDAPKKEQDRLFSERYACPEHGGSFEEPAPRNFSFNSPHGACPGCTGLGSRLEIDPDLVMPDESLSLAGGAVLPWRRMVITESWGAKILEAVAERYGFGIDRPLQRAERGRAQDRPVRQRRRAGRGQVPGAQREHPHLPHHLRGRRAEPGAALPRDGLGGGQGRDRALHDQPSRARPAGACG